MVGELRASHVIHLHRLMSTVASHCREEHGMPADRLDGYREYDVVPTDFKATKSEHERALMELAEAVGDWSARELDDDGEVDRVRARP